MDTLTRDDLRALLAIDGRPRVSIYLPTHRSGEEGKQDPIRLRNQLRTADERLSEMGVRPDARRELLAPAQRLLLDAGFWRRQAEGLALFLTSGGLRSWRLSYAFPELATAGLRFHVAPLLPLLAAEDRFYVLSLGLDHPRLLRGDRNRLAAVPGSRLPAGIEETLRFDAPEKQVQYHSAPAGGGGCQGAIYHGQGLGYDRKETVLRYCREVDRAVMDRLRGDRAPLIVASVDYVLPLYREANRHPGLLPDGIVGSPDALSDTELHARAWRAVRPTLERSVEGALRRHGGAPSASVVRQIHEVLPAAFQGRVEALFLGEGLRQWGTFDVAALSVQRSHEPKPGDEDLMDLAAAFTIAHGGEVYAVAPDRIPGGAPVAATCRY